MSRTRSGTSFRPIEPSPVAPASELLAPLLEKWPDLFQEVLTRLDATDRAVLAQVGKPWLAAVVAAASMVDSTMPRAGKSAGVPLKIDDFVWSVGRLAWAKANGCPWVERTCALAALDGHLEVLRWAREHGCPWDNRTCYAAAACGHLEVLRWARERGCPWHSLTCDKAFLGGHLVVLKWALSHGCRWDEDGSTCRDAAATGDLHRLQCAREYDCPWDGSTCALAAANGHLLLLRWAREHGCRWREDLDDDEEEDVDCCKRAASGGHLHVLKWLREHECPWNERTCEAAAEGGHLEVLKWVREWGCPWDE